VSLTPDTQRRAGRPRKAVLDRASIGRVALELVDEAGDFTLPELARRLGVQTASLYHHVEGRAGVIELLREQLGHRIDAATLGEHDEQPWEQAMAAFFRSYRSVFAAHPRALPLLATSTIRSPRVIAAYDKMAAILAASGVPADRTMDVLTALENFVIGSALDLAAPEVMWEIPDDVTAPNLAAALDAQNHAARRAERAFEAGLAALLAGLSAEVEDADGRPRWQEGTDLSTPRAPPHD